MIARHPGKNICGNVSIFEHWKDLFKHMTWVDNFSREELSRGVDTQSRWLLLCSFWNELQVLTTSWLLCFPRTEELGRKFRHWTFGHRDYRAPELFFFIRFSVATLFRFVARFARIRIEDSSRNRFALNMIQRDFILIPGETYRLRRVAVNGIIKRL